MTTCKDTPRDETVEAVATFAWLMHARDAGKIQDAAQAERELAALGVRVRFRRNGKVAADD